MVMFSSILENSLCFTTPFKQKARIRFSSIILLASQYNTIHHAVVSNSRCLSALALGVVGVKTISLAFAAVSEIELSDRPTHRGAVVNSLTVRWWYRGVPSSMELQKETTSTTYLCRLAKSVSLTDVSSVTTTDLLQAQGIELVLIV